MRLHRAGYRSWVDYSNKSGAGARKGREKLEKIVAQLEELSHYVPGIQTNFLFGCDADQGEEPVALTNEFIQRLPQVWPTINIPSPFGGTPLYDELYRDDRILKAMPFAFYYNPYLAITLKHYNVTTYYDHLIDMHEKLTSNAMLLRRVGTKAHPAVRFVHVLRTFATRAELADFRRIRAMLGSDAQFRAFHEGRSQELPAYYARLFEKRLGRYAELLPAQARCPILERPAPAAEVARKRAAKVAA